MTDTDKDRLFVTALARGLDVLSAFNGTAARMTNLQLASRTGLPKSTVSRLTYTLTQLGYLNAVDNGYTLGFRVLALAAAQLNRFELRTLAAPLMREFADRHQVSCSLATDDGVEMVYLECTRSSARVTVQLSVGSHVPMTRTAIGRAWLAGLEAAERDRVFARLGQHYGEAWPAEAARIETALAQYRQRGFTSSYGDYDDEVVAVGVPIAPMLQGQPKLAINASSPAYQISQERMEQDIAPDLVALADRLSGRA